MEKAGENAGKRTQVVTMDLKLAALVSTSPSFASVLWSLSY